MVSGRGESNVELLLNRRLSLGFLTLFFIGLGASQRSLATLPNRQPHPGVNVVHLTTSPKFSAGPILVLRASGARSSAVL